MLLKVANVLFIASTGDEKPKKKAQMSTADRINVFVVVKNLKEKRLKCLYSFGIVKILKDVG